MVSLDRSLAADGLIGLIGNTPLVRLHHLAPHGPRLFAKLEAANPAGSAKDRPALAMLRHALQTGELQPGDTVVESSSGNLGVALAALCNSFGLSFLCIVDPHANKATLRLIESYGGRVECVDAGDDDQAWLTKRRNRVRRELATNPRAWTPNQYVNPHNPAAHADGTMREIVEALDGQLAACFVATSTTGTLTGCMAYLREQRLGTRMIAVDAVGSVLFGGTAGERKLPGFGAGEVPELAQTVVPDAVERVSDLDCVMGARRLVRRESLLVGASGGGVVSALGRRIADFSPNDNVALIFHDHGSRYLETVFDDSWVERELGCDSAELRNLADAPWAESL